MCCICIRTAYGIEPWIIGMELWKPPVPWVINNFRASMEICRKNKFVLPHKFNHVKCFFLFHGIWCKRIRKIPVKIITISIIACRRTHCISCTVCSVGISKRVYPYFKVINQGFHPLVYSVILKKIICQMKHKNKTTWFIAMYRWRIKDRRFGFCISCYFQR